MVKRSQRGQRRIKTNRKRRSNRNNDRKSNRRSKQRVLTKKDSQKLVIHNKVSQDTVNKIYPLFSAVVKTFNKNKLDYWATGGTLLGAVRSKGMIQWDDDIDVAIQKKDIPLLESLKEQFAEQDLRLYKPSGKYYKVK